MTYEYTTGLCTDEELNKFSVAGWEVVAAHYCDDQGGFQYLLKRSRQQPEKQMVAPLLKHCHIARTPTSFRVHRKGGHPAMDYRATLIGEYHFDPFSAESRDTALARADSAAIAYDAEPDRE